MKRLFIAINLPMELKRKLGNLEKEINSSFPEETANAGLLKWVETENLHITLLFIGQAGDSAALKLTEAINNVARNYKPIEIKTKNICYGPPKSMPPRLIWLELEKNSQLKNLAQDLQKAIAKTGVLQSADERGFSGHITLARIKTWLFKQIDPDEQPNINQDFPAQIPVNSIELMESVLKRTGPEYIVLQSFPLTKKIAPLKYKSGTLASARVPDSGITK
ncbi:MAG: RNA 2',3'-cyclic phosphodiesterase [Candidatus Pacebacteria bacterium]|nr:RNA 2',3'-cyclic phosphodiesterase [Candidatus Paceibacterota bacterium]